MNKKISPKTDMKKFMSIVEGIQKSNKLSIAEQYIHQHYLKTEQKKSSLIKPYLDIINEELQEKVISKDIKTKSVVSKIMEKMYPGSLTKHISQSQTPSKLLKNKAKQGALKRISEEDEIDTVKLDIPLLMRVLEYAKEDAKTDMDLHNVVTKMIAFNKEKEILSMEDYDAITSTQELLVNKTHPKDR